MVWNCQHNLSDHHSSVHLTQYSCFVDPPEDAASENIFQPTCFSHVTCKYCEEFDHSEYGNSRDIQQIYHPKHDLMYTEGTVKFLCL